MTLQANCKTSQFDCEKATESVSDKMLVFSLINSENLPDNSKLPSNLKSQSCLQILLDRNYLKTVEYLLQTSDQSTAN